MNLGKQAAGFLAADMVEDGMTVGLGTGSTVRFFIERLIKRCQKGLNISAISSSNQSSKQAQDGGITLLDPNNFTSLDLLVDGADQIDKERNMIKGGGGALLREKILANAALRHIYIIDESKKCEKLGNIPLPIEITPFGLSSTIHYIKALKLEGSLRKEGNKPYKTDNGNYIFDVNLQVVEDPEALHNRLLNIPGVIETGFFFGYTDTIITGYSSGTTQVS